MATTLQQRSEILYNHIAGYLDSTKSIFEDHFGGQLRPIGSQAGSRIPTLGVIESTRDFGKSVSNLEGRRQPVHPSDPSKIWLLQSYYNWDEPNSMPLMDKNYNNK